MSDVYISKALRKDIPSEAVLLTERQAISMHWQTIKNWKPQSDTWPFRFGIGALLGINAATAINIIQHFRNRLKLGTYGQVTLVVPNVAISAALCGVLHLSLVTNKIFLGQECPLCIQSRAAAIQVGTGVVLPLILPPIAGFYYAAAYCTYDVPPLKPQFFREIGQIWLQMTRRLRMKLPIAIVGNALAASFITYFEAKSFYSIQSKIFEKEEDFKRQLYELKNPK